MASKTTLPLAALLFYFGTLYVFNVKSWLLLILLVFIIIFLFAGTNYLNSWLTVLFLALPFENSIRRLPLYYVGNEAFNTYTQYFGITPKMIIGLLVICLLLFSPGLKIPQKKLHPPSLILFLFFVLAGLNSLVHPGRILYIFAGFISLTLGILYFYLARDFLSTSVYKVIIISLSLFCACLGTWQLFHQRPLGKFIELTPSFSPDGYRTTDGDRQYRVSGFLSHPVYFGSFLSLLIPVIFALSFSRPVYSILILPLFAATLATLSRTTWINLIFIACLFYLYLRRRQFLPLFTKNYQKLAVVISLLFMLPLLSALVTRFRSLSDLPVPAGSLDSRLTLALNGLYLGLSSPVTGVGLNNFPFESRQTGLTYGFSAPPHNTLLIFFTELGWPAAFLFVIFLIKLLWPRTNPFNWDPLRFGLWVGLLTFVISAQFHPLFNLDPTFQLFLLQAGVFSRLCPPSAT